MTSVPLGQDKRPQLDSAEPVLSRRAFLKSSAIGTSGGLLASCSSERPKKQTALVLAEWSARNIPSQVGRRVLITGGNGFPQNGRSGLGYHDALALARAGADVTIASRNRARGEEAVRMIRSEAPRSIIRFEALDLADLTSVRDFTSRMMTTGQGLDLLINNAGVMGRPGREVSVDSFERVLATNTIGHFALTAQLLPLLRRGHAPRIVWVTSMRTADALPFEDLQLERNYDYAAAYDNSKLANLMLALEFDRRSRASRWGVASLASHPGVARTNLIPDGPGLDSREGWRFSWLPFLFQPATQGALPTLYASTSRHATTGGYYGPDGFQGLRGMPGVAAVPSSARDPAAARRLWSSMEHLSRISPV